MMQQSSSESSKRRLVWLFLLLSVLYHSNLRPVASGDSLPASLIPFSLVLDASIRLDRFGPYVHQNVWYASSVLREKDGHWYSTYPIAGSVLIAPMYIPVAFVPWLRHQPPGVLIAIARIAEKFAAVTLAAAAAVLLLVLLRRLTEERSAWVLTLAFALGTGNWSTSSQALWQHTFGQLAILGWLYAIARLDGAPDDSRWCWLAGAMVACAVAIRPTNLALLPASGLVLWRMAGGWKPWMRTFAIPAVFVGAVAGYNLAVFHSVSGAYPGKLEGRLTEGLLGVLVSPGRGLFVYTPIALFAIAAFVPGARRSRQKHPLTVLGASTFSLLHVAIIAAWPTWWGGYCWGPRLLTEILGPVMVLIAIGMPVLRQALWKRLFVVAVAYCCLIQLLGVYCYPKGRWDSLPVSVNDDPGRLWNWSDNPIVRTANGGVAWEPYSILIAAARGGLPAAARKLQELKINAF